MIERVYRWADLDKSKWGDGPWVDEPDKMQWPDAATGLPCLVKRNSRSGILCGYVGVAPGHPYYEAYYEELDVDVHGGLTYAASCTVGDPEDCGICHVPEPGEPDHVWWFGFDCGHCFDISPGYQADGYGYPNEEYRTFDFVRAECARLAEQLNNIKETV